MNLKKRFNLVCIPYFLLILLLLLLFSFVHKKQFFVSPFRITKPQPITASTTVLPQSVQQAVENLAKDEIKQEAANEVLPISTTLSLTPVNSSLIDSIADVLPGSLSKKARIKIVKIDMEIEKLKALFLKDKSEKTISEAVEIIKKIGNLTDNIVADPKVQTDREVLTLLIQQYNRMQLVIQQIEDMLPVDEYLTIEDARQKYLVAGAIASINAAPNLDAVHNIALGEVAKIVGEDFAELKAIEIVSDFESGVKPEARGKLTGLEKELAVEFEKRMSKLPRDVRNRRLQNYIQYSYGDPILQIQSFNRMRDFLADREIILGVDSLKEVAMQKLINRIFQLDSQEAIDKYLDRVIQNPQDLKVLAEMQLAVNSGRDEIRKQRLTQMEESVRSRIGQFFNKAGEDQLGSYFAPREGEPTDTLDVVLVSNLNAIVAASPEVSTAVKSKFGEIKTRTQDRFIREIEDRDFLTKSQLAYNPVPGNSDVRVLLSAPYMITALEKIRGELKTQDKLKIDTAIKAGAAIVQEHVLLQVNDPNIFADYEQLINQNSQVKSALQKTGGQNFFTSLSKKSQAVQKTSKKNEQQLYEVMQQIVQDIFITDKTGEFESKLPAAAQGQIRDLKRSLNGKNIPQLTVPEGINLPKVARLPEDVEQAIVQIARSRIREKDQSEDVKLDLTVSAQDLGIGEPQILPDSPLYKIKGFVRKVQLALTLDPVKRVILLIKQDNEKTLEAFKLIEKSSSRKTIDLALATLSSVQEDFSKLKENSAKLDKLKTQRPKDVDAIVDRIIRNGLARQTVFSAIENKVYGADYVKVEKIRQSVLVDGVEALLQLSGGDAQVLVEKLEKAADAQSGSKFKQLKAIELLTEIKRFQGEKIGQILENSEIRLVRQFETHLLAIDQKERDQELLAYAEGVPGNPVRQFEAYEQLKDSFENKQTLFLVEALKDKAVENLRDQISEINDSATLAEFVREVVGDKPEDLKIIVEIESRVQTPDTVAGEVSTPIEQKIKEVEAAVEENIIENYADNPSGLLESDLFFNPSSVGNTTITDVETVQELVDVVERSDEVGAEVVETVQKLEDQVVGDFIETVSNNPQQALEPVPEVIETLVELKEETPDSVDAQIDDAIASEVQIIQEHLTTQIDSPETLETYLSQIEESPIVSQIISQVGGDEFIEAVLSTTTELSQVAGEEQNLLEETIVQVQEEIFSSPINNPSAVEETLPEIIREEIAQIKEEVPIQQTLEVTISTETTVTVEPLDIPQTQPTTTTTAPAPPPPASEPVTAPPVAPPPETPAVPGI